MKKSVGKVVIEALSLPVGSRAFLAGKLLESLDANDDFEISSEWMEEIGKRCKEIDDDKVVCIPADRVFKDLRANMR